MTKTTTKCLNDVQVGDRIIAMGDKQFTDVLQVVSVDRYKGSVVCVKLDNGKPGHQPFWPIQPGRAEAITVTVYERDETTPYVHSHVARLARSLVIHYGND